MKKPRNACLDSLRGLAIVLMIIDHSADILFHVSIDPSTIRMATRLSMPLFCGLMGYFLVSQEKVNWHRFYQLCLATLAINLVFFTIYGRLEILASLLVCYTLFLAAGRLLALAVVAVWFFQLDGSAQLFDYPLSVVLSCVAQGMVLRLHGWRVALLSGGAITLAALWVAPPSVYVLFFVLPATLAIAWAAAHPQVTVSGLERIGHYPLTVYLIQYYVLLALGQQLYQQ
ncbi:MAG: hypothetical protein KDA45_08225 [Planctomycetales bacterium]|nr:hypothetical protein [Planctomycetales bacterium]